MTTTHRSHKAQATWRGWDGNDREIFYWDGTTIYQMTDNLWMDQAPMIWDRQITWQSYADSDDWEVMEAHVPAPTTPTTVGLRLGGLVAELRWRRRAT